MPRDSIDLRRTIRRSICRGGELIDLRYKGPKKEHAKLVILLDVSDSMNPYSFFLLKFAYVLGKYSREVKSFIFSTNLVEISNLLRSPSDVGRFADTLADDDGLVGGHENRGITSGIQQAPRVRFALPQYGVHHLERWLGHRGARRIGC